MPETIASQHLKALLELCGKSRAQVAAEVGYERPNIISMLKGGHTPIPLDRAGALALAVGADPAHFVRLVLESYAPDTLEAIRCYVGELVSQNERELIQVVRDASGGSDPELTTFRRGMLEAIFARTPD